MNSWNRNKASLEKRFQKFRQRDPFYEAVDPALLNSRHIRAYIYKTGMINPYYEDNLKSASYTIRIGNRVIYWDKDGKHQDKALRDGEVFELPANSIVFIETLETFRLPDYMAVRFNLKISAVHKGILLGTGPLVDPGYAGTLLIPLHNLITNNYYFHAGQPFVWVEFTKVSSHGLWKNQEYSADHRKYTKKYDYKPFPENKKNLTPEEYLAKAHSGVIRSSIPDVLERAQEQARQATRISWVTMVGVVAIIIAVFFGMTNIMDQQVGYALQKRGLDRETIEIITGTQSELDQELNALRERIEKLEERAAKLP